MTLVIEVVVEGSVHRREFLQRAHPPEPVHRALASVERRVGVVCLIVDPTAVAIVAIGIADHFHRRSVRAQSVGDDCTRAAYRFMSDFNKRKAR